MTYIHFIGIDVSKEWFDVALQGEAVKPQRYPNDSEGFAALAQAYGGLLDRTLVVLESTGGYETALIDFLLAKQTAVHRADPLSAKHFIRSLRLRGKTDALDAKALARYGYERHGELALVRPADAVHTELELLTSRRGDLIAMRAAEQNRLKHPRYATLLASIHAVMERLTQQIDDIERRIEALVQQSVALKHKYDIMIQCKGIGKQTACTLLAHMPQLGALTRRQAASLAGCAPHPKDSGKITRYRSVGGGKSAIKRALFMAAMAARNWHPELKTFYQRLICNGKKPMVALTAVMRKLITILNAKIRDQAHA